LDVPGADAHDSEGVEAARTWSWRGELADFDSDADGGGAAAARAVDTWVDTDTETDADDNAGAGAGVWPGDIDQATVQ